MGNQNRSRRKDPDQWTERVNRGSFLERIGSHVHICTKYPRKEPFAPFCIALPHHRLKLFPHAKQTAKQRWFRTLTTTISSNALCPLHARGPQTTHTMLNRESADPTVLLANLTPTTQTKLQLLLSHFYLLRPVHQKRVSVVCCVWENELQAILFARCGSVIHVWAADPFKRSGSLEWWIRLGSDHWSEPFCPPLVCWQWDHIKGNQTSWGHPKWSNVWRLQNSTYCKVLYWVSVHNLTNLTTFRRFW